MSAAPKKPPAKIRLRVLYVVESPIWRRGMAGVASGPQRSSLFGGLQWKLTGSRLYILSNNSKHPL
jgi:hypothetical protein